MLRVWTEKYLPFLKANPDEKMIFFKTVDRKSTKYWTRYTVTANTKERFTKFKRLFNQLQVCGSWNEYKKNNYQIPAKYGRRSNREIVTDSHEAL